MWIRMFSFLTLSPLASFHSIGRRAWNTRRMAYGWYFPFEQWPCTKQKLNRVNGYGKRPTRISKKFPLSSNWRHRSWSDGNVVGFWFTWRISDAWSGEIIVCYHLIVMHTIRAIFLRYLLFACIRTVLLLFSFRYAFTSLWSIQWNRGDTLFSSLSHSVPIFILLIRNWNHWINVPNVIL